MLFEGFESQRVDSNRRDEANPRDLPVVPQLGQQGLHLALDLVLQQSNQLVDENLSARDQLDSVQSHVRRRERVLLETSSDSSESLSKLFI